jgi:hypothetical protein
VKQKGATAPQLGPNHKRSQDFWNKEEQKQLKKKKKHTQYTHNMGTNLCWAMLVKKNV